MNSTWNKIILSFIFVFLLTGSAFYLFFSKEGSVFQFLLISIIFLCSVILVYTAYMLEKKRAELRSMNVLLEKKVSDTAIESNIRISRSDEELLKHASLIRNSTNIISMATLDGKIHYINPSGLKMLGIETLEDALRMKLSDMRSESSKPDIDLAINQVKATGQWEGETEYVNARTGKVFPVSVNAFLIRDSVGSPSLLAAISRDISQEKKINGDLQKTLSLLLATFDSSADGILAVDKIGKIVNYNNTFAEMWNIPRNLLETKDDEAAIAHVLGQLELPGEFVENIHYLYAHPAEKSYDIIRFKDGKFFERFSLPQKLGEEIIGRVWTFRDVTEREKASFELKKAADEIYDLYNNAPCGYFSANKAGVIININNTALSWLGYKREEIIGVKYVPDLMSEKSRSELSTNRITFLEKGSSYNREYEFVRKDGSIMPTLLNAEGVKDENGLFTQGNATIYNIEERKKNEEELLAAKKIAEDSLKFREQFLANMSHEIRTPISGISGLIGLLKTTQVDAEQMEFLDAMKSSSDNLLVIINDILDISKLEAGKMELEEVEFDLREQVHYVYGLLMPKAKEKGLDLFIRIADSVPAKLTGDSLRINQVIINLLNNGIKFTEKGNVTLDVSVKEENAGSLRLLFQVTDTGIGIAPGKLAMIFESFTQAGKETTRKYGGTGLGLAIVKKLVEIQGGITSVKSEPGKGSVFTFEIPFPKIPAENKISSAAPVTSRKPAEDTFITGTALIAEDHPVNQLLMKKLLERWGMETDIAEDGMSAVEMVQKKDYDLVLMDIQMPEMDGYEATSFIRNHLPEPKKSLPIIAMTAYASLEEKGKCLAAGMNDYLSKPFQADELYAKIIHLLGQAHTGKESPPHIKQKRDGQKLHPTGRVTDLAYLHELADGSQEFITDMIEVFLTQTPLSLANLRKLADTENWEEVRTLVHRMKPGVGFVGIKKLELVMDQIEEYTEKKIHLAKVPSMVSEVESVCLAALGELRAELNKISPKSSSF